MNSSRIDKYYLPMRSPVVAGLIVFFCIMGIIMHPNAIMFIIPTVQLCISLIIMRLLSVFTVGENGIVLYRINRLEWSNVEDVRHIFFLGQPYLLIKKYKGFNWWLPLYFKGTRPIEEALTEKAPIGNPIRIYAESKNT